MFDQAALDAFSQGPPSAPWLLLEAPLDSGGVDELHAAVAELADRGFGVLLAHPERSPQLLAAGAGLDALRAQGVPRQVNATSLTGWHGEAAAAAGLALIRAGAVRVVASDAHGADRPPRLTAAVAVLRKVGVEDAERLVRGAPRDLLRDGLRPPARPPAARRRPSPQADAAQVRRVLLGNRRPSRRRLVRGEPPHEVASCG
jgi:protein-tyrosine phosphatase